MERIEQPRIITYKFTKDELKTMFKMPDDEAIDQVYTYTSQDSKDNGKIMIRVLKK